MSQQPSERLSLSTDGSGTASLQYFANARSGSNRWWRWVVGIVMILVVWIGIGSIGLGLAGCELLKATKALGISCSGTGEITGDGSLTAKLILGGLGFVVGLAGLWGVVRLVHRKSLRKVLTGRPSFDTRRYLYAMGVALVVSLVIFLVNRFVLRLEMTFNGPGWEYVIFAVFALLFVPLQTGFEEAFFRGYVMQGTMLLVRNKVVLAVLSGIIFSLPHLTNPEASTYGFLTYVTALVAFGAFFGLLTLLDGGIEIAAGYHAVNNLFMGLVANTDTAVIVTPSLFTIHRDGYSLFPHVSIELLAFVLAFVILNHKYRWVRYPKQRAT